jgi:acetyl-CoA decarbonylase/synthase complex subunit epsilon
MNVAEPWRKAEIPGPTRSSLITEAEVVVRRVKAARRPVLVVGHEVAEVELGGEKLIDYSIRISKAAGIPIVATAHVVGEFLKRGVQPSAWMSTMDVSNRLSDPNWSVSKEGGHDLAIFLGFPYNTLWLVLSGLKHFAPHLKTISLDRFYHPHSTLSFPTMSIKRWRENLEGILQGVNG